MDQVTMIAIREVFASNHNDAIRVTYDNVMCPHTPEIFLFTNDCEIPSLTEYNDRKVILNRYRLMNDRMAIIGQCPKCDKVYYME